MIINFIFIKIFEVNVKYPNRPWGTLIEHLRYNSNENKKLKIYTS